MVAYYNEVDKHAARWLRQLIAAGLLPDGHVDERSVADVQPEDVEGYTQCHFFAGIGGWAYAARLAGWPDDRPLWTGSCPCQPFSVAGRRGGAADRRHLWPDFFRLIRAARPACVFGEQVAGALGYRWLDGVRSDLAAASYASRAFDIPACAVDAPQIRSRLYWVALADAECGRWETGDRSNALAEAEHSQGSGVHTSAGAPLRHDGDLGRRGAERGVRVGDTGSARLAGHNRQRIARTETFGAVAHPDRKLGGAVASADGVGRAQCADAGTATGEARKGRASTRWRTAGLLQAQRLHGGILANPGRNGTFWSDAEWLVCHDGKARRTQPCIPLLADGLSGRVAAWRGLGNAIVPQLAAEVMMAFLDSTQTLSQAGAATHQSAPLISAVHQDRSR